MNTKEKLDLQVGDIYSDGGHPYQITAVGQEQLLVRINGQSECRIQKFDSIFTSCKLIERNGKLIEPKPETQEDRIKAEYPDFDVVMLEMGKGSRGMLIIPATEASVGCLHTNAQSMRGFYRYVCEYEGEGNKLFTWIDPVHQHTNHTQFPIAVLFYRLKS